MTTKFIHSDKRVLILKEKILNAIDISDSIEDVVFCLKNDGVKQKWLLV